MRDKLCIVTCGNFYREVMHIVESEGYSNVDVRTFPSECVTYQKVEYSDLENLMNMHKDEYYHFEIICNEGCVNVKGISKITSQMSDHFHITNTDLCFGLLVNKAILKRYMREGYYILTPGWLKKWRHYIIDVWKFDQVVAKDFFKESTSMLLLLDTGVYGNMHELMQELSEYVDRPFKIVEVGLDYMKSIINKVVAKFYFELELETEMNQHELNQRKLFDYAMIFDIFSSMGKVTSEINVIESMVEVLKMLFNPGKINYVSLENGDIVNIASFPEGQKYDKEELEKFLDFQGQYMMTPTGKGFIVSIDSSEDRVGLLWLDDIPRTEYISAYLNTLINIKSVFGLAVLNARIYQDFVKSQANLAYQKTYFQQLFKNSPDAIIILDENLCISDINDQFSKQFQFHIDEIKSRTCEEVIVPEDDFEHYLKKLEEVRSGHYVKEETKRLAKDGTILDMQMLAYPILNEEALIGVYVIYSDISHRKRQEEMIKKLAYYDALTGLSTRGVFNEQLKVQLNQSKRNNLLFAVVFIDLNKFKAINDTYGHDVGDQILIETSKRLLSGIRESDTAARVGGDEFTLILRNIKLKEDVEIILVKLQKKIEEEFHVNDIEIPIRASMGAAIYPDDATDVESLLKKADEAMYQIKQTGKSGFKIHNST